MRTMWKPKVEPKPENFYWQLDIAPDLMLALADLLNGKKVPAAAIGRLKTTLLYARRFDLPLDRLGWGEVQREAHRQGCSESDVLFDWMARKAA